MPAPTPETAYRQRIKHQPQEGQSYRRRRPAKHRAEMALVERAFQHIPSHESVLDIPCGAGRATVLLARRGYRCTAAEAAPTMVQITREALAEADVEAAVEPQDIEAMDYADRQFGAILCFRLFHHFPNPEVRQRVIAELCRVADRHVALSWFSPWSVTSLKRRLRAALGGRPSRQHATPRSEIDGYFRQHGFRRIADHAQAPLLHTLHLAVYERIG